MKRFVYLLLLAATLGGAAQASMAPPPVCVIDEDCDPVPATQQR